MIRQIRQFKMKICRTKHEEVILRFCFVHHIKEESQAKPVCRQIVSSALLMIFGLIFGILQVWWLFIRSCFDLLQIPSLKVFV